MLPSALGSQSSGSSLSFLSALVFFAPVGVPAAFQKESLITPGSSRVSDSAQTGRPDADFTLIFPPPHTHTDAGHRAQGSPSVPDSGCIAAHQMLV